MSLPHPLHVVGIAGSPAAASRSRALLGVAMSAAEPAGARTTLVDLSVLSADGLLARRRTPDVDAALLAVHEGHVIIAATPVYRATYTGLLKLFFDLLPPRALAGKVALGIATAGSAGHEGVIDHGLRPLFASLEAIVLPAAVFATDADFTAGVPHEALVARVRNATARALQLCTSVVPSEE